MAGLAIRGGNGEQDSSEAAAIQEVMAENNWTEEQARKALGLTVVPPSAPAVSGGSGVVAPPSLPTLNRNSQMDSTLERVAELGRKDGAGDIKKLFETYTQSRTEGASDQYRASAADLEGYFRSFDDSIAAALGLE